jgi:hypothetical protein
MNSTKNQQVLAHQPRGSLGGPAEGIAWVFSALIITAGLLAILSSFLGGEPLIGSGSGLVMTGILVAPGTVSLIRKRSGLKITGPAHALCVVVAFLVLTVVGPILLGQTVAVERWHRDHPWPPPEVVKAEEEADAAVRSAKNPVETPASETWTYYVDQDAMRGSKTNYSEIESNNLLYFSPPYEGGGRGTLTIRRTNGGSDILLRISKGQFICNPFSNNEISAKFDEGGIQHFHCATSSDGDTSVVFVTPERRFLSELKRSSRLVIEVTFFQEGMRQLTFNIRGLKL